ncbi:MAG: ABC-F family ATP-binding cassette domain-containing protein [Bacillaceae bacterium]
MKMLTVENISKNYGEKELFTNLSFTIHDGQRIGIIGINGSGKSTLMKIIAAKEVSDSGDIHTTKGYTIGYLSQNPEFNEDLTILDQVFYGDNPLFRLLRRYELLLQKMEQNPADEKLMNEMYAIHQEMDAADAWDTEANAKSLLTKLGITDYSKKVSQLSGGQKKRVAMAQCFIQQPDLLILDEPTNHLDHKTIGWLEEYLNRYQGAVLFVTHDRYFLDRVTNRIFEIDGGKLYTYEGNYQVFIEGKAIRKEQEAATEEKLQNLYRRELAWMRRGAKARTTKQKARIQRFEQLEDRDRPQDSGAVDISLSSSRLGKKVIVFKDVTKSFGDRTLIKDFTYTIKPHDRIGIVGSNGVGKSTMLNLIAGKMAVDSGEIEIGATVKLAYYTQESVDMDVNARMIDYIREESSVIRTTDGKTISASQMLERFLFPSSMHGYPIGKLSGGERKRLYLLRLLMASPNVLLLDEPTNDLDTETLTVLEDYLEDYSGVVITVSHDRYFLDKVAHQLLVLDGSGDIDVYFGEYSELLQTQKQEKAIQKTVEKEERVEKKEEKPKVKKKLSYHEQREWEGIEAEIEQLEQKIEDIEKQLEQVGSDYTQAQKLIDEKEETELALVEKMDRWAYLSELIESF